MVEEEKRRIDAKLRGEAWRFWKVDVASKCYQKFNKFRRHRAK
jgi:hypothetical protein